MTIEEKDAPQPQQLSSFDEAVAKLKGAHEYYQREFHTAMRATKALIATTESMAGEFAQIRQELKGLRDDLWKLQIWKDEKAQQALVAKERMLARPVRMSVSRGKDDKINGATVTQ